MRKLLIIPLYFSLILMGYPSEAQYYTWFKNFPGSSYTGAEGISVDPDDNVLIAGNFNNGINIEGTTYTGRGSFLLKLTKNGVPRWHKIIRYAVSDFWALSHIGTDAQGNSYIAGTFPETATVDGVAISGDIQFNSQVAKFNSSGVLQWVKVLRGVPYFYDVKVNSSGDVLLYTHHFTTFTIDNTTLNVGPNSFGVLLNSDGDLQWAKALGDPQRFTTWPKSCALDNSGNAYFHGIFNGTFSLDGKQAVSNSGHYDFFVARVNTQGICEWITTAEREAPANYEPTNPPNGLVLEPGAPLEVDNLGNVYLGGIYWMGLKIGSFSLPGARGFLLKLNSDGEPIWATPVNNDYHATIEDIIARNGSIYVSGITPDYYYFSQFTPDGDVLHDPVVLPVQADIASSIAVDSEDSVYVSGRTNVAPERQGFAFKYRPPVPEDAGMITGPTHFCISESELEFDTPDIFGAQSYEWSITVGANVYTITTSMSTLQLSLADFQIAGNFLIVVRGVNEAGRGTYSPELSIVAEVPLNAPALLLATCGKIYFEEPDPAVKWYYNNVLASRYQSRTSILPDQPGEYFVTVSNTCGTAFSNEVTFSRYATESIFIPNIITPNSDGLNEKFVVDPKLESSELIIYNRWGKTIFQSKNYVNEWDGQGHPTGIYYYWLNSGCMEKPLQGSITIAK